MIWSGFLQGLFTALSLLLCILVLWSMAYTFEKLSAYTARKRKAGADAEATWQGVRPGKTEPPPIVKPMGGIRDPYVNLPRAPEAAARVRSKIKRTKK